MKLKNANQVVVFVVLSLTFSNYANGRDEHCRYIFSGKHEDLILPATSDLVSEEKLQKMKWDSRTCLPPPCDKLEAYSGFIPVDEDEYLFFLHIKSEENADKKPLLLWLQGGPGKSSLYGQFLENGPLGIDASGKPYRRKHTLLKKMNIVYVDQPVGAGYSFGKKYPGTIDEASIHLMRFIRRFLRIYPEYTDRTFYVAGESYGARSAVGVVQRILTRYPEELPLQFKGVMLGVGFLFPLLELINSADYLHYSGLLDENSRYKFAEQFEKIAYLVQQEKFQQAALLLSVTVMNMRPGGQKSLFQNLTGFEQHASIATTKRPREYEAYFLYANDTEFKKRIHVDPSRALDGTRAKLAMQLAVQDFFADISEKLEFVFNNTRILFYTAEFDAVFPAVNIESQFRKVYWRGAQIYKQACRQLWHRNDDPSDELLGYLTEAGALLYATVLFGGHYISQERSEAVSELYGRFLNFPNPNSGKSAPGTC